MQFKINDYKLLCNRGSANFNEDIVGLSPYGTWVLDGATGLNNKNLVSKESDAKWYVNWWNSYLHKNINRKESLKEIISDGIDEIRKEYFKLIGENKVEQLDFPSCSCSILKFHEDKIEYLMLGDCTLFVGNQKSVKVIKDDTVDGFDRSVFDHIKELDGFMNMTLNEKKDKAMPIIINNRLKKNSIDGYWVLEFSKEAIDHCINGFIEIEEKMKIMLASDGFSCGYDKYRLFEKEDMIKVAHTQGIDYIYKKIRDLEQEDEMGIKFPRFKVFDDASCVYLDIYR